MKQGKRTLQLNNVGFSLVELLIGVTILAVITVPLLHMFVTSGKINAKSRKTLRATVVAQDLMEGVKAYHVEELKEQFADGELELLEASMLTDPDFVYYEDVAREIAENGEDPSDSSKANPGLYYFVLRNVAMEKSRFDVLVRMDATGYVDLTQSDQVTYQNLNNNRVARITSMNQKTDAWYQQTKTLDESVLYDVQDHFHLEGEVTYETPGLQFEGREITICFEDDGTDADGNLKTQARITYRYRFTYGAETYDSYGAPSREVVQEYPCGSFTGKNFYFFYYPLYQGKDDRITLECHQTNGLQFYLAKQLDTDLTDAQLHAAEMSYKAIVNIEDLLGAEHFSICTNLGHNLVNEAFLGEGADPEIVSQVDYQLNGAVTDKTLPIYQLSGIRDQNKGAEGIHDTIHEFIYDIVVEVYEQGAAEADFPEHMRKATISGTKN